jgi:hypothetical protein
MHLRTSIGIGTLLTLIFTPAYAAQHGNAAGHAPKGTTTHGAAATVHGPSTTTGAPSAKGPKTTHGPSAESASTKPAKTAAKKGTTSASTTATTLTTPTTSTTGTVTTIDFTAAPVGQKLSRNTALRSKIETRLQTLGYSGTVYQAAYGFKNLGQFVAATNVSQNLKIPFDQLKVQMTGLSVDATGKVLQANIGADGKVTMVNPDDVTKAAPTKSLGQSIQTAKSSVDPTAAAQTATAQADAEIQSTSTTTTARK